MMRELGHPRILLGLLAWFSVAGTFLAMCLGLHPIWVSAPYSVGLVCIAYSMGRKDGPWLDDLEA